MKDDKRPAFVDQLVQLTTYHALDGLDIDLENDVIDSNYGVFIRDLATKMKPLNKLLTAALATWNAEKIPEVALKEFDFINVMSYDQTGPWRPDKPGHHSTYEKAVEDLQYWKNKRHVPADRINLGVPFYGYVFNSLNATSMTYEEIVKTFRHGPKMDCRLLIDGGTVYYNGIPTKRKKTQLALQEAGGVMLWQLLQDDPGKHSLLKVIDKTRRKGRK